MTSSLSISSSLIILLLCTLAFGQKKGYEPGYIINKQGDTLYGYLRDRSPEPFVELYRKIRFIPEGKRSKKKYGPSELLGYSFGGRDYAAMPFMEETAFFKFRYYTRVEDPPSFLRVIRRDGPLTYYHKEFVHDDNDYLDQFPLIHREGSPELVRVTQGILGLKRQQLMTYFSDCKPLVRALEEKTIKDPMAVYELYLEACAPSAKERGNTGRIFKFWF